VGPRPHVAMCVLSARHRAKILDNMTFYEWFFYFNFWIAYKYVLIIVNLLQAYEK